MKTILVHKYQHSTGYKAFPIQKLGLKDKTLGAGAFGEVYECTSINDKSTPSSLAAKIFFSFSKNNSTPETYKTVLQLQERMKFYEEQKLGKALNSLVALEALPRVSFQGELNGKIVYGYLTKFYQEPEWIGFHRLFDEEDLQKRKKFKQKFYQKSIEDKLEYAKQLVEGFKALRAMSFIHADLNPQNIFINLKQPQLAIIDYDSGAITHEGSSDAETFGKLGDWLAPEIRNQLLKSENGKVKVNLYTDAWSVAIGIHAMLFWAHPLFYLKSQGKVDMKEYYKNYKYPSIDISYNNFRKEYEAVYNKYLYFLQSIPTEISEAFNLSFNEGYHKPSNRISYSQWEKVLNNKSTNTPPKNTAKKKRNSNPEQEQKKQVTFKIPKFAFPDLPEKKIDLKWFKTFSNNFKSGFNNLWKLIFTPPEIKELKRKITLLEKSERSLTHEVSTLNLELKKLSKEKNSLSGASQSLEKKNIRLVDAQQKLLAERNNLLKENTSYKRSIDKLTREVKFLQSKKWLGENEKKAILILILALLISWSTFLFALFGN